MPSKRRPAAPSAALDALSNGHDYSIAGTVMGLARMAELALGEVGLSLTQYRLLGHLLRGHKIQSDLAFQLSVTKQSVTRVVDSLVARGLVARQVDAADKRRVVHRITSKGRQTHRDANQRIEHFYYLVVLRDLAEPDRVAVERGIEITQRAIDAGRRRIPLLPSHKQVGEPNGGRVPTRRHAPQGDHADEAPPGQL